MAFTLSEMIYGALKALGQTVEDVASATGTTTTAISSNLSGKFNDDDLVGGTLFVRRDAAGASAAPEGEFGRISANSDDGTALTVTFDALSAATGSGDRIGIAKPLYSLQTMIERANDALAALGRVPVPDTSLTTVANQTDYTLPIAMKGQRILSVEVQTITNISGENGWIVIPNYKVQVSATGSTETLILPELPSGYTIRITYLGVHSTVNAFSDKISEYIDPRLAKKALEYEAINDLVSSKGQSASNFELQRVNKAQTELEQYKALYPIRIPPQYPKYATFGTPVEPYIPIGTVRL